MSRLDAVNYISHGIAKVPGESQPRTVRGADVDVDTDKVVKKGHEALDAYCVDLNKKAAGGHIDPLIGRQGEIERTIQILCRRNKNNPLYVGDPGVGKTAIAEGLARRIFHGEVPDVLLDCTIFALDMGSLLAGTPVSRRLRGTPEGRYRRAGEHPRRHPVHRRDPHRDRRRRHQRRLYGRLQYPQAVARRGEIALHGLDHLYGLPQLLRKGPGPGAPVPEDRRL